MKLIWTLLNRICNLRMSNNNDLIVYSRTIKNSLVIMLFSRPAISLTLFIRILMNRVAVNRVAVNMIAVNRVAAVWVIR